jgi:hypothetical protein
MFASIAGRDIRFLTGRMMRAVFARRGMSSRFRILEQSCAMAPVAEPACGPDRASARRKAGPQ